LVEDRIFDLKDETDETYREIDAKVGREFDFVITGHTHLERALRRTNGSGYYYNTGTWAGIMRLEPAALKNDDEFGKFYRHLSAGSLDVLEKNKADVESLLRTVKGLVSYTLARGGDGGFSVTVCQDQTGIDESIQKARDWIAKNAAHTGTSAPRVSSATVITHLQ